ncbi:MAG: hypothetical protein RI568_06740 [Natronomonas sp.]|uniref:hypothetical protein n=1 Tax=Natronomonas sp. TaxID=2184060 RepID=UPI00287029F2|nr:hypothetical protein [Natronomonas sp.]MDR9430382.1 hypothetical protein [Natronomonas sp.]
MDSASPIAQRIAGEHALDTGITFTVAMRTKNAENTLKSFESGCRPGGYRHRYHRSYGEGPLA